MKTSLEWLGDFLPADAMGAGPLDAQAAAEALTNAGLPVESMETIGGDTVLDVEVTSNRGDCLCHRGLARELAALLARPMRDVTLAGEDSLPPTAALNVGIEAEKLCPQYTARVIRGGKIGSSPAWMVRRLEAVGIRPVNNVVDVTNYVMLEMGQPLHAFDLARIRGGRIIVRSAAAGEFLLSIDGRKRELAPAMLVIADAVGPVALAGVMGGLDSEVSPATVDVVLESARFDPLSVRRTARALAMKSDSSYRFERGIDPNLPSRASLRAGQLIVQLAGGKLEGGMIRAGEADRPLASLSLRLSQLQRILGLQLPVEEVIGALARLGLSPVHRGQCIDVTVPSHRLDIGQEIDLVEEVARVLGYDRIATREEISIRLISPDRDAVTMETICQTLVGGGYFEAITFSFVSDALRGDFGPALFRADPAVRKADGALRPSLIPGLLEAVRLNENNGTAGAKLFEIGSIFPAGAEGKPKERRAVAWVGGDLRHVRGVLETLLERLDAERAVHVEPASHPGFAAGACGRVLWGQQPIGFLGQIDRAVGEKLSLRDVPAAVEVELLPLLTGSRPVPQLRDLPKFPAVRRDISLIVAENLPFEKIDTLLRGLALPFLDTIDFVTTYRGKPLDSGSKSVTLMLVFRSNSGTLTSGQVETSVQQAVAAAREKLGAKLRG